MIFSGLWWIFRVQVRFLYKYEIFEWKTVFLGILRAHISPWGPAWALEEREKFRKNMFFSSNAFLSKIFVFNLHIMFFNGFNVLLSFLAEKWYRTIMKLPQKTSFGTNTCSFGTSITLPTGPTTSPCQAGKFQGQAGWSPCLRAYHRCSVKERVSWKVSDCYLRQGDGP